MKKATEAAVQVGSPAVEGQLAPMAAPASAEGLMHMLDRQRFYQRRQPSTYSQRRSDLKALYETIYENRERIAEVLIEDFGHRSRHETLLAEVMTLLSEIKHSRKNLRRWMRPKRVATAWQFAPGRSRLLCQPLGCVGIISAWNYPVYLALSPLVSALAAGNHVMLKTSEFAPKTGLFLQQMLAQLFPVEQVAVIEGGSDIAGEFAALPFDHLLFTGSTSVGKKVMQAASQNLTPVTLELGGKSPAIVTAQARLSAASARIVRGKLFNAGQTCIAPDYILVEESQQASLLTELQTAIRSSYKKFDGNPDYTHIVNDSHYQRLQGLLQDAEKKGAAIVRMGEDVSQDGKRVMAPVLVSNLSEDMRLLQEEVFGPILPIKSFRKLDDAIEYICDRPNPLALYVFSEKGREVDQVIANTLSGGVTVNDTLYHISQHNLPFGGVGQSGMGHYHGEHGFLTFSKQKPVFIQARFTTLDWAKPPYAGLMNLLLKMLIRKR